MPWWMSIFCKWCILEKSLQNKRFSNWISRKFQFIYIFLRCMICEIQTSVRQRETPTQFHRKLISQEIHRLWNINIYSNYLLLCQKSIILNLCILDIFLENKSFPKEHFKNFCFFILFSKMHPLQDANLRQAKGDSNTIPEKIVV